MTIILDRKLFKGNAQLVCDGATPQQMLESVNANFKVVPKSAEFDGRQFPQHQLWMREDDGIIGDCLGCFGNRRQPQQPLEVTQFFQDFCDQSEKQITPDVVGCVNGGKSLYVACRMAGDNSALHDRNQYGDNGGMAITREGSEFYASKQDRTEHWLMLLVHFGESLATKAYVLSNELRCSNGMALRTDEKKLVIPHRAFTDGTKVQAILNQAVRNSHAYDLMKNRFQNEALEISRGVELIREFHSDPDGEKQVVKNLERIYRYGLIGGELPERQGNYWRLLNAQTQYTSHNYVSRVDAGKTLLSQIEGSKARDNRDFIGYLESQFTTEANAELVLA